MAKNFQELRAGMSAEAKAESAAERLRLVEEEIRAVFPDGRAVKITQFSE
jgi:hypothetical protein